MNQTASRSKLGFPVLGHNWRTRYSLPPVYVHSLLYLKEWALLDDPVRCQLSACSPVQWLYHDGEDGEANV